MQRNMPVSGEPDPIPDIGSLRELLKHVHFNSFILLDLDNTLMESTQALGSDQWFTYFLSTVCQLLPNEPEAILWVLAIYDAVQHFTKVQQTEVGIARLIKMLQAIGIPIVAVTARGESIIEPTLKQLDSINISFAQQWSQAAALNDTERRIVFSHGIIFCNGQDKGFSVKLLFDWLGYIPQEILMVDDKRKHLEAVAKVLEKTSRFQGLRYAYLDAKVADFDAQQSDQQLLLMLKKFPLTIQNLFNKIPILDPASLPPRVFSGGGDDVEWEKNPHSFFKATCETTKVAEIACNTDEEQDLNKTRAQSCLFMGGSSEQSGKA